nr:hypothetical protein 27 [bacterium]
MKSGLNELTLCVIVKNDEKESVTLRDALFSVKRYVDYINITVTKSKKEEPVKEALLKVFEECGSKVFFSEFIWCDDFSAARNFNLSKAKTELTFWIDSDDIVMGAENLPKALHLFEKYQGLNALWMDYRYAFDDDGNCINIFPRERIFKKSLYQWKGRLHENALCLYQPVKKDIADIYIKHNLDKNVLKAKGKRNLSVIKKAYQEEIKKENPDARTYYDYGRSLVACGFYNEALGVFENFLDITGSQNDAYETMMRMGELSILINDVFKAKKIALKAIDLNYAYPDAYLLLAKCAFVKKQWAQTLHWIEKARGLQPYNCGLPLDPLNYDIQPMKMAADCLFFLNRAKESLDVVELALKKVPSDEHLKNLRNRNIAYLKQIELEKSVLNVLTNIKENKKEAELKNFLKSLPDQVSDLPAVIREKNRFEKKEIKNRIVIYCHETHEDFGVDKIESGIGGSEEAVINLSRELSDLGWNVEVYCSCSLTGYHEGVLWKQFYEHDINIPCDVFIAWRHSEYVLFSPKNAYKVLWLHDRQDISTYTPEVINTIDKIFVLSKYHRNDLPQIPDEKFYITRNGINTKEFVFSDADIVALENNKEYRNNIIYASSPDRGLDVVLDNWHKVKEINPEAVLHIFYGFTPAYDEAFADNPVKMAFKKKILDAVSNQPDVFYHGRVGHLTLSNWFKKCGFWFYPTYFTEISCITAMKAQAAGAIPIASDKAALKETINTDIVPLFTGDILEGDSVDKWLEMYKKYVDKNNYALRKNLRTSAIGSFGYEALGRDWSKKFKEWIEEKKKRTSVKQEQKLLTV